MTTMKIAVVSIVLAVCIVFAGCCDRNKIVLIPQRDGQCRHCECSDDGKTKVCGTISSCRPAGSSATAICTPGTARPQDCNICLCAEDGKNWVCSNRDCNIQICISGTITYDDCNVCECVEKGRKWRCTQRQCPHNLSTIAENGASLLRINTLTTIFFLFFLKSFRVC